MLKNKKRYFILIFLLSMCVRIGYLSISNYPDYSLRLYDAPSWDGIAWNLVLSRGFVEPNDKPTSVRPPIYPIFLATIYYIFGRNYFVIYIIQSFISSLTNMLIFLLFNYIFNTKIAFLTALITSIWPAFVVYSGLICSETLYVFLFILFLIFYFKSYVTDNLKMYILTGCILGILNLTRSTIFLYPIFLMFFFMLFKLNKKIILNNLIMFLISLIVISPWTVRNYLVFKRFLLINTAAAELFWSGTYIPWDGICRHNRDEDFYKLFNLENPVDNERKMIKEGIKNIISNPLGFVILSVKKFYRFWFKPIGFEMLRIFDFKMFSFIILFFHVLLVIICWVDIYLNFSTKKEKFLPWLVLFIYFTVMHNILAPIPRYRLPLEVVMLGFSVNGILRIFGLYEGKNNR
ncbi:MAG: glycosyltransferase family 39 protein [Endomicrobiia bacterium]